MLARLCLRLRYTTPCCQLAFDVTLRLSRVSLTATSAFFALDCCQRRCQRIFADDFRRRRRLMMITPAY